MNIFFTSDEHYGHKRICEFANRPYRDVVEMREAFIRRHNEVVRPGDQVYHLGDFCFESAEEATKIAKRLTGQKFLIWGNHDKNLRKSKEFQAHWGWCKDYAEIKVGELKIVLAHYPFMTWNKSHHGSWNIHGHCHGSLKPDPHARRVDAGVDVWDYRPVSYEEVAKVMSTKTFVPVDQHGAREGGKY